MFIEMLQAGGNKHAMLCQCTSGATRARYKLDLVSLIRYVYVH